MLFTVGHFCERCVHNGFATYVCLVRTDSRPIAGPLGEQGALEVSGVEIGSRDRHDMRQAIGHEGFCNLFEFFWLAEAGFYLEGQAGQFP